MNEVEIKKLCTSGQDYNSLRICGKVRPYPCLRFTDFEAYKRWERYQPESIYSYYGDFNRAELEDIWVLEISGIVPRNPYIIRGYLI